MPSRVVFASTLVTLLTATSSPGAAQILDGLKEKVSGVSGSVSDVKDLVSDARGVRCEVEGVCGEIQAAPSFAPEMYTSLAVTFSDASRRFARQPVDGLVRGIFEGQLLENGFLMAASSDVAAVQERIARGESGWSDQDLAQLQDFIHGIDAVLVTEVSRVDLGRCELGSGGHGTEATVHVSARWLNVDAGDIPWLGRHWATVCEDGGAQALTGALEKASVQLAGALPTFQ